MKNICEGIKAWAGAASNIIELTRATQEQYEANRKAMCPAGYCDNAVKQYVADLYPNGAPSYAEDAVNAAGGLQCNEFPFARTVEGGNVMKGARRCVPASDNNWQGGILSKYFKKYIGSSLNPDYVDIGERFIVVVAGWDCETNLPDPNDLLGSLNSTGTKSTQGLSKRDAFASGGIAISGGKLL